MTAVRRFVDQIHPEIFEQFPGYCWGKVICWDLKNRRGMEEATLLVPFSRQNAMGAIRENARVVKEDWDEEGARLIVRAPHEDLEKLRSLLNG